MSRAVTNTSYVARLTIALAIGLQSLGGNSAYASSHGAPEGQAASESAGEPGKQGHGEAEHSDVKSSGVKLGEFKIRSDYPAEAQKSTVRFVIYATVAADHLGQLKRLTEEHQQKIRDEIITTTRLTPLGIFQEPNLATFRRRILIRLRRTLPELNIEQLYVSDFGLIVNSL
jgi:hypothetical protein